MAVHGGLLEPGDTANLPLFISSAPTDAPVVRMRDVLVIPTVAQVQGDLLADPAAGTPPADLGRGLVLTDFPQEEGGLVMASCMPRGHFFHGVRQWGTRYAFVKDVELEEYDNNRFGWDADHTIFVAMLLSRLVRDNGYSLEFAARIIDHADGMQQVIPAYAAGFVATYRLRNDRDWLTLGEAEALRDLLAAYWRDADDLPWRVIHALNLGEDVVHARIVQRAVPLVVTGLEALSNTSRTEVSRQFRNRLPALAAEVAVAGVSRRFARRLYDARSEATHGAPVSMFEASQPPPESPAAIPAAAPPNQAGMETLARGHDILKAVVRRAIEDQNFRAVFADPAAIRARWPVRGRRRLLVHRPAL